MVITLNDHETVKAVIQIISKLKNTEKFKKGYIDLDKLFKERRFKTHLRAIINTVAKGNLLIVKEL